MYISLINIGYFIPPMEIYIPKSKILNFKKDTILPKNGPIRKI